MQHSVILPSNTGLRSGRRGFLLFLLLLAGVVLFGGRTAISYYVDTLWFGSLGYGSVFWKTVAYEWTTLAAYAVATFFILYGWTLLLVRSTSAELRAAGTFQFGRHIVNLPLTRVLRFGGLLASLAAALLAGAGLSSEWPRFALFLHQPSANGVVDPIFGRSLNFYLFTLPVWQYVSGWLLALAILLCGSAALFALVSMGSRLSASGYDRSLSLPWRTLSVAGMFLLLVIAMRCYVGRFEMIFDDHTVFSGVSYTDAHVLLPGTLVLCWMLVLGAAIAAINLGPRPRLRWMLLAPIPGALCFLIVQLTSWYVTSFIVKPNQLVREQPYISHNIAFTRQAFALDRIQQERFPAEIAVEAADPQHNQSTLDNIRLWDWFALRDTLRQIQEIRTYYDFPDVDIDRYPVGGQMRQMMLAVRELNAEKLPESSRNWINEKLIYTHGYGTTMNPVNGFTPEGLPKLVLSDMPMRSTEPALQVTRPEIYFGQLTDVDVYVKTRQKEFNYPQGETNSLTSYEGSGGIAMGGLLRRILIAFDRGDLSKVPFSDDIGPDSRLMMRRNVETRIKALAPFLTFDGDPYIVVRDDGGLSWVVDAFTSTDTYPYASHYGLQDQSINYLRNSVKAVVDAYTGETRFYVFDAQDPVISAYRNVFPSLFRDASSMPQDIRRHVRYPELLLGLQAQVYSLYHMTDPVSFYNREDLWTIASEVGLNGSGEQATQTMEPNFVLMKLPGKQDLEFVDILPFTPSNRNNLIGWIAGRSDGANYGTAIAYDFPKSRLVDGPMQIEARIDQDARLSAQLTLWNQQGSHVRRGTLLVIPCGKALIYAEPIYLQAERSPMPELRLVVLALQDKLAYGASFEAALQSLFAGAPSSLNAEAPPESAPSAAPGTAGAAPQVQALIHDAARDLGDYQRLTAQGKLAEAGQKLEQLKQKLDQLNARPH